MALEDPVRDEARGPTVAVPEWVDVTQAVDASGWGLRTRAFNVRRVQLPRRLVEPGRARAAHPVGFGWV